MTSAFDDFLSVLDSACPQEVRVRVLAALESPHSALHEAAKSIERWARQELNPLAPSPDVDPFILTSEPSAPSTRLEERMAAMLGKSGRGRGQVALARTLLDKMAIGSTDEDYDRIVEALADPNSELAQLVQGFERWATHSLKHP